MVLPVTHSRRFVITALTILTATFAAAGCGSSSGNDNASRPPGGSASRPPAESVSAPPGESTSPSHATQTAIVVDPCAGAPGTCTHVANTDVDGDGTPDQIGIAYATGRVTTIVAINGTRHSIAHSVTGVPYTDPTDIYRGAFLLSRAHGADLVLHLVDGSGNAEQFAVISWDGDRLVALPEPPRTNLTGAEHRGIWYLRSSHGGQDSVRCRQPGETALTVLTAATSEGIAVPGGGRREENYYTFVGSSWQPTGSDNIADSSFSYMWDAHTSAFDCADQGVKP